ncbi:MAG: TonB-dependent receptor [Acidobacteria bacterium]|nr:TonB-dependent receptor [Acidobacteriota bacterium]
MKRILLLVLLGLPVGHAAAQVSTAAIVGTIRDASAAAVPGAVVTAVNVQTGLTQNRQSGVDGAYSIPLLPVGQYRLEVHKTGFQRHLRDGITLAVNDRLTLDVTLEVGSVAEQVTVTGAAPLVEAQSGALRGGVDQQRMVSLPLNGRNMTQLVAIQAGVIQTADSSSAGEGVAFAVNGSRQNGVYYLLDGGYNTGTYRNWSGTFPNPDAVQEFSVQRNNFSAEYGNGTGAVVNVVTKSGTNQFHGSAFEFVRNSSLNARNFFAPRRDTLKRNQFGATLGGPVLKDKLFFFGSYQATRLRSDPQLSRQFLPTSPQRAGDFSSVSRQLIDPQTRQPFPGNRIPLSRFSPVTLNFLKYIPSVPTSDGQRFTGAPNVTDTADYTGRLDWNLGSHRLSGKAFVATLKKPFFADPNDIALPLVRLESQPYRQVSANHLYTFSPTLINSATFAYRYRARFSTWDGFEYPINFKTAGVRNLAINKPAGMVMSISGFFDVSTTWPYEIEDSDWHWADTLTYSRGGHEIKIGGEFIRSRNQIRNHFRTMGLFTFDGSLSGNAMADYMLGEVYNFQQGGGEYKDLSGNRVGLFVHDDWRIRPSFTFNLGVRWDPTLPFTDTLGRVQCFRPGLQSTRFPKAPAAYLSGGDPGCPEGGFDSYLRSFAPRVGFAWRPHGSQTVVRGGIGLFWNPQFTVLYNGFVNGAPFSPQVNRFAVRFDDPYESAPNPFPQFFAPFNPPRDSEFFPPLGLVGSFDPRFQPSYAETWNLTVEREVTRNMLARVSYVGNLGRRLSYNVDVNYARYAPGASARDIQDRRPFQAYGQILMGIPGASSGYHGLQMSLERRFSSLSFEANYTWSKSIDDYSADPTPGQSSSLSIPFNRKLNQGLSDFDVPHRFVASYVWALPALSPASPWVRAIFGSWETSGIWTLQSGRPFSVTSGRDNAFSGINRDYANLVGNPFLDTGRSRAERIAQYFQTSAYATNTTGAFGTAPRNHLRGPGSFTVDLAVMKNVPVRERMSFQFRTEFFNAFNQPNFNNPFSSHATASRFGRIESAGDPRIIQLGLKFLF